MAQKVDNNVAGFEWKQLPEFSELLNRLGTHGFRLWPETTDELRAELDILRVDPEDDIALLWSGDQPCGYALALREVDIDRVVASMGVIPGCQDRADLLLNWLVAHARGEGVSSIHIALRDTAAEPVPMLLERGFTEVTASLELKLDRAQAASMVDYPLPEGFSVRPMRSSRETLLLTRVQNTVFADHWGFSKNTPEEIQAKLDLPATDPVHVLFIDSPEGDVAAYVWTALEWADHSTCGRIWMTGVMPKYRKSGLGKAIVSAGIKHLLAEGANSVTLEVVEHNTAAIRIYKRAGFKQSGRVAWYDLEL